MFPYDNLEDEELGLDLQGEQMAQADQDVKSLEPDLNIEKVAVDPAITKPISNSPTDKYSELMNEYKKLQEESRSNYRNLGILDALSGIGQAFAMRNVPGAKVKSNMDFYEKLANRPVQDYSDRIKQAGLDLQLQDLLKERDPSSTLAQQGRKLAEMQGYKPAPDMSAKDLAEMQKLGNPLEIGSKKQGLIKNEYDIRDLKSDRDPSAVGTDAWRAAANKMGIPQEYTRNASRRDLEALIKLYQEEKDKSLVRNFQTKMVTDPQTGEIRYYNYNTSTGEMIPMGAVAGYAPKTIEDKRTGETVVFSPALGVKTKNLTAPTPQAEEQAKAEIPELNRENLTVNQQKQLEDYRKSFLDDTKDDRNSLMAAKGIQNLLKTGDKLNGDILRLIQNKFARASGERGAMTESDVAPYGGRQEIIARIERNIGNWSQGKITDEDRKFLSNLATAMEKQTGQDLSKRTQFFSNNLYKDLRSAPNLKDAQFTPQSVEKLLGSDVYTDPNMNKVQVIDKASGKKGFIPKDRLEEALASGKFELVK